MHPYCNIGLLFWGFFATVIAAAVLRAAVVNAEKLDFDSLRSTFGKQVLGIAVSTLFLVVGIWQITTNISCLAHLLDVIHLEFTFWPPMVIIAIFGVGIGVSNARHLKPVYRESYALLVFAFTIAVGEGAAFHTGAQAERWFAVGILCLALSGLAWWVGGGKEEAPADESSE